MKPTNLLWTVVIGAMYVAACGTNPGTGTGGSTSASTTSTGGTGGSTSTSTTSTGGAGGSSTSSTSSTGGTGGTGGSASSSTSSAGGGSASSTGAGGATSSTAGSGGGSASSAASSTAAASSSSASSASSSGVVVGQGLPCDVVALLQSRCWTCHGTTPYSKSPLKLLTHADLIAPAETSPSETNAELSTFRMQNLLSPMPPGPYGASASEVATLQAWINAGYPTNAACSPPGADLYAAPAVCGSGQPLDPNQEDSPDMNPGRACNACHNFVNNEGSNAPVFAFAGTVFPSAHEPDDCLAPASLGAMVEVTDGNGVVITVPVTASGNFLFDDLAQTFVAPYTARVLYQGRDRRMDTPQTDGDCNTCHSQSGNTDAPGRILLP